jgi:hypothetical protein
MTIHKEGIVSILLKRRFATWDPALVGLVPGVSPDVLLQVRELGELPLADLAAVGLDAQVDSGVLGQVGTVCECFVTAGALVGLRLPHVDLGVQLQVGFTRKNLKRKYCYIQLVFS